MYYLGIDLGGTNIAAGVVNEQYQIIGRSKIKTHVPCSERRSVQPSCRFVHILLWKKQISPWMKLSGLALAAPVPLTVPTV